MNSVEISVQGVDPPDWMGKAESFAGAVLSELGKEGWELSILLCGDSFIRSLNAQYRGKDAPTDVLSFEQGQWYVSEEGDRRFLAGDVVISLETLGRTCADLGIHEDEELKRLILHGILHLSGFDHDESDPRGEMLEYQESLLKKFSEVHLL
ncbi:MAG: rRNA maturation RNase YbeY [Treponema sp.]|nr:rRNA maturation RNase YbeY [Treponema sp.]